MTTVRRGRRLATRTTLALLALCLSCSSGTEPGANAAAVQILPASVRMSPGDTLSLSVSAFDDEGTLLPGASVSYESSSPSVVTVSGSGMLRAIGLGTATVTVSVGSKSVTVPVTVVGAPWAVQVTPARVRALAGDSVPLGAQVMDATGAVLTGLTVTYTTGNAAVATVSAAGVVHAVGAGMTTIQAASGLLQSPVPVSVYSIQVTPSPASVQKDSSAQLTVAVHDSTGTVVSSPTVTFHSADPTVATVSATGLVQGIKYGVTTVSVSYAGFIANDVVQVVGVHPLGVLDQTVILGLRPYGVAISPSGLVYVTQLDGASVGVGQLPTVTFASAVAVGSVPTDIAFNSTGTKAYVANQFSHSVGVIDVATGQQVDGIPLPAGDPFRVLVSADDQTVYVSTNIGTVIAFDASTKAVRAQYSLSGSINGLALQPAGQRLYATDVLNRVLYEINTGTGVIRGAYVGGAPQDIAVSPDGATLYVADEAGALQVRSAATGSLLTTVAAVTGAFGLKLSADGAELWVSAPGPGRLQVVNTATLTAQSIGTGIRPRRIAFDQNGTRAVVANEDGSVLVFR